MMRTSLNPTELYTRWVGIIYLIAGTMGAAYYYADFWGLSGLPNNWTLIAICGLVGISGAIVGLLIGKPGPCYAFTMLAGIVLTIIGLLNLVYPGYTAFWGGENARLGDGIFDLAVGLIGLYIAFSSRVKSEGGEAQPGRAGQ
jgi:hypothetical protein